MPLGLARGRSSELAGEGVVEEGDDELFVKPVVALELKAEG
jgi:hypothetical protein